VLVKNTQLDKGFGRKLEFRWLGPYKITEAFPDRNYYQLAELDGALLKKTTHGDRLKKYHQPDVTAPDAPELTPASGADDDDINAEMYEDSERTESSDDEPSTPPVRRSGRVVRPTEKERERRLAEGLAVDMAYLYCDDGSLSRWEKFNCILHAESYYQYPPEIRRKSTKQARSRRKIIAVNMKETAEQNARNGVHDPHYWDDVLSELRKGWHTGKRDGEGRDIWSFEE
jgi:hypothetical protein